MASEYLKWKYRDVKPDEKIHYTKKQKALNWWQYHKWWVLLAVILLVAGGDILFHMLGLGTVRPDYQIAYVASVPLDGETVRDLESALASLGEDCNGDGKILVQVNSYVDMAVAQDTDAPHYAAAAQVRLMADMETCESYFYLCADPEKLQQDYQILARADGELAGPGDAPFFIPWETVAPKLEQKAVLPELKGLFLARRGFWKEHSCSFRPQCDALWARLTEELIP
jgi:hypothetical protein